MHLQKEKSQNSQWNSDGDLLQDCILDYSEMPGGLDSLPASRNSIVKGKNNEGTKNS